MKIETLLLPTVCGYCIIGNDYDGEMKYYNRRILVIRLAVVAEYFDTF